MYIFLILHWLYLSCIYHIVMFAPSQSSRGHRAQCGKLPPMLWVPGTEMGKAGLLEAVEMPG